MAVHDPGKAPYGLAPFGDEGGDPLIWFWRLGGAAGLLVSMIAQAAPPPVHLGLWEITSTTTLSSAIPLRVPPAQVMQLQRMGIPVPGTPTTRTDQSCINEHSFDRLGDLTHKNRMCRGQNIKFDEHGLDADIVCDGDGANGHGQLDLVFDDSSHLHGTMQINGRSTAAPGINGVNVVLQGHWIAAQCGATKPLGD